MKFLRPIIALFLICIILSQADLSEIGRVMRRAYIPLIILSCFILSLSVFFTSAKLKLLLSIQEIKIGFFRLLSYQMMSAFFSSLLPSTLGGDVAQVYLLKRDGHCGARSTSVILISRFTEIVGMSCFFLLSLSLGYKFLNSTIIRYLSHSIFIILIFALFIGLLWWQLLSHSHKIHPKIGNFIKRMHEAFLILPAHKGVFCVCLLLSFGSTLVWIWTPYLLSLSINMKVSPLYFFIFIPMINLITATPISVNGIGLREGSYALLFAMAGQDKNLAISLSFLVFSLELLRALIGGIIYLLARRNLEI
ncbi:MAG: lysylphosphatidylglycerol synthase transmembrane domain-containing protein [bacterium]